MIVLDGVRKGFGRRCIIRNATGQFAGGLHLIEGENGVGKTTLLNMLCGLVRPTAGMIRLGGLNLAKEGRRALRRVMMVPAQPRFFEGVTVDEALRLFAALRGTTSGGHEFGTFDPFALHVQANERFGDLSLGWKKKVILHMAFATDADLLLLDEPTLGLDAAGVRTLAKLLDMRDAHRVTVFTCHEPKAVQCARVHKHTLVGRPEGSVLCTGGIAPCEFASSLEEFESLSTDKMSS